MFRSLNRYAVLALAAGFFTVACSDDDNMPAEPVLPTTYNFENVDYSGQAQRIQMLDALEKEAKKANNGSKVTAATLTAIFENSTPELQAQFGTDKNIAGKTETGDKNAIYAYFGEIERLSGSLDNVKNGYLVDENGVEPTQLIAKGLMGSHQYWQVFGPSGYLSLEKLNAANNSTVKPGQGTDMQHYWDEAFGYFGAPKDFPINEGKDVTAPADKQVWYWAKYANSRSAQVDIRQDIMNAFIKGRSAIGRNDMAARDEAIATIREKWELLVAANVMHYINDAKKELADKDVDASLYEPGIYYHNWSEAKAFASAFQYNTSRKINNTDIASLQALLGNNPGETNTQKLEEAGQLLQRVFNFTDTQTQKL